MRSAYFSEWQSPGQREDIITLDGLETSHQAFAGRVCAQTHDWTDELTRQQAIYEELLASPEWAGQPKPPALLPGQSSVRRLTRDLAGWSPPQPGALRTSLK